MRFSKLFVSVLVFGAINSLLLVWFALVAPILVSVVASFQLDSVFVLCSWLVCACVYSARVLASSSLLSCVDF